jgi:L-ribulokinase
MLMQIYADVTGREMKVSRSARTCALGSAVAAAVVGKAHKNFAAAQKAMCGLKDKTFKPDKKAVAVYKQIYALYLKMHDSLGIKGTKQDISNVMKDLLAIKEKANA